MPKEAVLNLGYPTRTKLLLCLPAVVCAIAVLRTLASLQLGVGLLDVPILVGAALACLPAVYGFRASCVIDGRGITRRSLWGSRHFDRGEFLGHERIAAEPGAPPSLLLRFKSGVVFLSAGHFDRSTQEVIDFLEAHWQVSAADYQAPVLGAVDPVQSFEYETMHLAALLTLSVVCLAVATRVHVFAMLGLLTFFCLRAAWRAMGTLETDENGITFRHRYGRAVTMAWREIESVSYWNSFAQGGVKIRNKNGGSILLYRWIDRYPMFNRLLHDRLDHRVFWPNLQLPLRIDLNRRRRMGVLAPYVLLMVNALELLWDGNMIAFALVWFVPTFIAAALIWGSSRSLEITPDGVRDIWRYMWFEKLNFYKREDLIEARLGRQLTVGGLWMRFGDTRLEIANTDASLPPEQILMCLRAQWAWEQKPDGLFTPARAA